MSKRHKTKPMHPSSPRAFRWYQARHKETYDLGDLNVTNKQINKTKQNKTTYLNGRIIRLRILSTLIFFAIDLDFRFLDFLELS